MSGGPLRVLVVDDEQPALEELAYLLRGDPRVGEVVTAGDGESAVRVLEVERLDGVFLDIRMPGLDGRDIARVVRRFARPPAVVFVTAYEEFAVDAFTVEACDYLLKPVRRERLAEAVRRVAAAAGAGGPGWGAGRRDAGVEGWAGEDERIPVELSGVTRFVSWRDVRYVEAQGDYVRVYEASSAHLVRIPLAALEERWARYGFARAHRRYLVALRHVEELAVEAGHWSVRVGGRRLPVSRRHARELRDLLVRRALGGSSSPAAESPPRGGDAGREASGGGG